MKLKKRRRLGSSPGPAGWRPAALPPELLPLKAARHPGHIWKDQDRSFLCLIRSPITSHCYQTHCRIFKVIFRFSTAQLTEAGAGIRTRTQRFNPRVKQHFFHTKNTPFQAAFMFSVLPIFFHVSPEFSGPLTTRTKTCRDQDSNPDTQVRPPGGTKTFFDRKSPLPYCSATLPHVPVFCDFF